MGMIWLSFLGITFGRPPIRTLKAAAMAMKCSLRMQSRNEGGMKADEEGEEEEGSLQVKLVLSSGMAMGGPPSSFNFLRLLFQGAVAGATAGVVVETVLYPIDTIKTRLQAARAGGKIVFKGLYSGIAGNLAGVLPSSSASTSPPSVPSRTLFPITSAPSLTSPPAPLPEPQLPWFESPPRSSSRESRLTNFLPLTLLSEKLLKKKDSVGFMLVVVLLRDLPFDSIQFCVYEQLKITYCKVARRELYDPETALIGAFAGAITGAVTSPLDVIKTRLMIQGDYGQYKGALDCVSILLREEGPSAFLKGIGPRVLWIGIGGSIFFGVLERTKQLLASQPSHEGKVDSKKEF